MPRGGGQPGTHSDAGVMSPVRVFVFVLATVFLVETVIMLLLEALPPEWSGSVVIGFADSALLVAALCPVLWVFVISPLRALVRERGELIGRVLSAQEDERARLARDLHDALGQTQTAVPLGLGAIRSATTLEESQRRAEAVHAMAVEAVESTRRLARGLSPVVLHDFGLSQAVARLAEDVSAATGVAVELQSGIGAARLSPEAEIAAYRVVQEALTNAVKHAQAARVTIGIRFEEGRLRLSVRDDGRGLPEEMRRPRSASGGLGMVGMRERLTSMGGRMWIQPGDGGGTIVNGELPIGEVQA